MKRTTREVEPPFMSLAPEMFWQLLKQSGLLPPEKLDSVRARIAKKESIASSSTKIARLLVANKLLTEKQAKKLLSGKPIGTNKEDLPQPMAAPSPAPSVAVEQPPTDLPRESLPTGTKSPLPIILAVALPLTLLFGGLVWFFLQDGEDEQTNNNVSPTTTETQSAQQQQGDTEAYEFVESEKALWARENPGTPIDLKFAPAGVQAIVRLRLAELDSHPEGAKIIRSMGPDFKKLLDDWLQRIQVTPESFETFTLYLLPQGTTLPQYVVVAALRNSRETIPAFQKKDLEGISRLATDAIWFPNSDENHFVFGPAKIVADIRNANSAGDETILRRELEQLRLATHHTDHVTLLGNPNFLRDEAQGLFPNTRRRLLDGLYEFWSQDAQAVSLGLQLTAHTALAEARMIAREDLAPRHFAGRVERRLAELPSKTRDFLGQVELDGYWQRLALRFPAMVEFLTQQTRVVTEGKQVAISAAVPPEAVHNLLLASELSFASTLRSTFVDELEDRSSWTIEQLLASSMKVRFAQKSLDIAMRDIAQQVRDELTGLPFEFTIEVVGTDLEPEGITRNQQIRDFEATGTLSDALTALVRKANPDQSVTTASDANQKLIWVPAPDQSGKILISTRVGAKNRGINLPAAFVE